MVYIVGVDHLVQYNGLITESLLQEFYSFLDIKIKELKIDIIAEEFNNEFLTEVYCATEDTARSAAEQAGIEHIYCDPESKEREELGIPYYADIKEKILKKYNVNNFYCPNARLKKKIKNEINKEVRKHWGVREEFWYEKLKKITGRNILFICGHEHAERFLKLLVGKKIPADVIEPFWKRNIFSDYSNLGLR